MKEKKTFQIPVNVRGDFEIAKNVTLKDTLFALPVIIVDIPIFLSPLSLYAKIPIGIASAAIPAFLIFFRPVRENIAVWKHLRDSLRFTLEQKDFEYRKDVEQYENSSKLVKPTEDIPGGEEETTAEKIRARSHSASVSG